MLFQSKGLCIAECLIENIKNRLCKMKRLKYLPN